MLGLDLKAMVLLTLTLLVATLSLGTGRTTVLQGAVHLVIFAVTCSSPSCRRRRRARRNAAAGRGGRGMMRLGMHRLAPGVLAAIAALSVVLRIGVLLNRRIDPDESPAPPRRVAHHPGAGPVPRFPRAPPSVLPLRHGAPDAVAHERPAVYFAARGVMVLLATLAVYATWRLGRGSCRDGAIWAAVILALAPQFAETSTETRPDVPALVAHLAGVLALVESGARAAGRRGLGGRGVAGRGPWDCRSRRSSLQVSSRWSWRAGAKRRLGRRPPRSPRPVSGRDGARAGRALRWLGSVHGRGHAPPFCGTWCGTPLPSSTSSRSPVFGSEIRLFLAAALGLGLVLRGGLGILAHPVRPLLLPTLASASVLFLPRTPAVYQHAWLPLRGDGDLRGPGPRHAGGVPARAPAAGARG